MILSFSLKIKGEPTHFVEKIVRGLLKPAAGLSDESWDDIALADNYVLSNDFFTGGIVDKIHTIRVDQKGRWKVGNKIHFVIHNRTPNRYQFAPVVLVKSVQEIEINYPADLGMPSVIIDGKGLNAAQLETLAINDGFKNSHDFFNYFDSDFVGRIIGWTDYKY